MSFVVKTTWHASDNPNTIYAVLKRKLGREPTNAELRDDVQRILADGMIERDGKGNSPGNVDSWPLLKTLITERIVKWSRKVCL